MPFLDALTSLRGAFERSNIDELKALGGSIAEEAFLGEDRDLVDLGVIGFSLAKLLQKRYIVGSPRWKAFFSETIRKLDLAAQSVKAEQEDAARELIASILLEVEEVSSSLGRFHVSVVAKARTKIATDLYAHGASLGQACELTGAEKRFVSQYIGLTKISDKYETLSVAERFHNALELFSNNGA